MEKSKLIAQQFTEDLDLENYESAIQKVDKSCVYEIGKEIINGAEAIIESYRINAVKGKERFDSLFFESSTEKLGENKFKLNYIDKVTLNGKSHVYKCSQLIQFNDNQKICYIKHIEIKGERETLMTFEQQNKKLS